jgi:hypothetical protein
VSAIGHNRQRLMEGITDLSSAKTWEEARREWEVHAVYATPHPSQCLCGQYPISELCEIRNRITHNQAIVGNVCVKQFIGLPSDRIFAAVRRITGEEGCAVNEDTIELAHRRGWFNDWERGFYLNTWRKRRLSGRQAAKRVELNRRLLGCLPERRPGARAVAGGCGGVNALGWTMNDEHGPSRDSGRAVLVSEGSECGEPGGASGVRRRKRIRRASACVGRSVVP